MTDETEPTNLNSQFLLKRIKFKELIFNMYLFFGFYQSCYTNSFTQIYI